MKRIALALALLLAPAAARATNCAGYTYTLTNGQLADANQVMANFNSILNCANVTLIGTGSTVGGVLSGSLPNPGFANQANNTILGNISGAGAGAIALTGAQVDTILPAFVGDSGGGGTAGVVPAPPIGSAALNKFLGAGGAWVIPPAFVGDSGAGGTIGSVPAPPVGSAAAGKVLGAGGTWIANPALYSRADFKNQQSNGVASGETIPNMAWTQRVLNTASINTIAGASLASNQVTLPAGTYVYFAAVSVRNTSGTGIVESRLRNTTDSTTISVSSGVSDGGLIQTGNNVWKGIFTLAGAKVLELDTYFGSSASGTGGAALGAGEPEVYVDLFVEKVG